MPEIEMQSSHRIYLAFSRKSLITIDSEPCSCYEVRYFRWNTALDFSKDIMAKYSLGNCQPRKITRHTPVSIIHRAASHLSPTKLSSSFKKLRS